MRTIYLLIAILTSGCAGHQFKVHSESIHAGMTKEQVIELMGPPEVIRPVGIGGSVLRWTKGVKSTDVVFDGAGIVKERYFSAGRRVDQVIDLNVNRETAGQ